MSGIARRLIGASSTTGISFRYVQWLITEERITEFSFENNSVQASQFTLFENDVSLDMSIATVTNPDGNNQGFFGPEGPENLVDGNLNTKWLDFNIKSFGFSELIFDFGTQISFDSYTWNTANDAPGRDPVSWTVSGSNDGSDWQLLATVINEDVTTDRFALIGPFDLD